MPICVPRAGGSPMGGPMGGLIPGGGAIMPGGGVALPIGGGGGPRPGGYWVGAPAMLAVAATAAAATVPLPCGVMTCEVMPRRRKVSDKSLFPKKEY